MAKESRPTARRPTIRDVAERAGVSKSLVSLVIHDSPRVSDKSRAAVLKAIDELGYRPSASARSLVNQRSNLCGVVTANAYDTFYASVLVGLSEYLIENELGLIPMVIHGDRMKGYEARAVEHFLELQAQAIFLLGSRLAEEEIERYAREVPVCVVGRAFETRAFDVITNDDEHGAALATRHLIELGHERILHTTGGEGNNGVAEREAGYRRTMSEAGLQAEVVHGGYGVRDGAMVGRVILEKAGDMPTAIVAANDLSAIGLMETLRAAGHHVPGDISIVGYDDIPAAGLGLVDLTTIHQPASHMGMTAARLTCARSDDPSQPPQTVILEPELVVRSSTQPVSRS